MSKIVDGLKDAVRAAKCPHDEIEFVRHHMMGDGLMGRCRQCECRFTAWPGSYLYEEIAKARDLLNSAT